MDRCISTNGALSDHEARRPPRKHASPHADSPFSARVAHSPRQLGNLIAGLERTMMYIGRFRTFSFSPLDLNFVLHSQIITFTIIALALDVVRLTTIHPS